MRTLTDPEHGPAQTGTARGGPYLTLALDRTRPLSAARRHDLTGIERVLIGRSDEDDARRDGTTLHVGIADPSMSERHAVLIRHASGWEAADEGSKNGTFLDGKRLTRADLADGALFEAGRCSFVFRAAAALDPGPSTLAVDDLAGQLDGLATFHPELQRRLMMVDRIADSKIPVLILGETGTGKEVLARAIHTRSRRPGELVAVNCGALPAPLLESILFGHRKGAFSGATDDRAGLFRAAHRGTLFLDEIGELSPAGQVALLRVLETGEVLPIGETRPVDVDVRVVAATLRDLRLGAAAGTFRDDLLARIGGFVTETVPLRARREDLGLLLARLAATGRLRWPPDLVLSRAAAQLLFQHRWLHNIRELVLAFEAALTIGPTQGELPAEPLAAALAASTRPGEAPAPGPPRPVRVDEADQLRALLAEHRGNLSAVARALATSRTQLGRLLARFQIDPADYR